MSLRLKVSLATSAALSLFAFAGVAQGQAFYLQEQSARGAGRAFRARRPIPAHSRCGGTRPRSAGWTRAMRRSPPPPSCPGARWSTNGTLIRRPGQPAAAIGGQSVSKTRSTTACCRRRDRLSADRPRLDRLGGDLALQLHHDYDANSWARYSADRTKLLTVDIQPSIGVALTDWLRVGGAVNVEYTDASLGNALPNLSAALPDGAQKLEGHGWDLGWTAGVQMHNDFITVGIAYKSRIQHNLKGDLEVSGLVGPLAAQNRTIDGATRSSTRPPRPSSAPGCAPPMR